MEFRRVLFRSVGDVELLPDDETGVLNHGVEAVELRQRFFDEARAGPGLLEVLRQRKAADFVCNGLGDGRVAAAAVLLDARVVNDDGGAALGEGPRVGSAEAGAGAGDERDR